MYQYKREALQRPWAHQNETALWGWVVIFLTLVTYVGAMYALVVSKFMPLTGNPILDWIKEDYYYSSLLMVMIPVTVIFVYLNWLSLKFFRHN
jgi:hypothetical protein